MAVAYMYTSENLLQKAYVKLLDDLKLRFAGRVLQGLLHAYENLKMWRQIEHDSGKPSSSAKIL